MYNPKINLVLVLALTVLSMSQAPNDDPQTAILFKRLETPETTDQATEQLLKLAANSSEMKKYLATHLPSIIDKGPTDAGGKAERPWINATRIAGQLKLVEAIPSLVKWFSFETGGTITLGQAARLEYHPAAKALSQIGDPAVPSLERILSNANLDYRKIAVLALTLIGSNKGYSVLRAHVPHESDPGLRDMIQKTLENAH